jgi:DNA-3-methyladenine glycosylase
VTGVDDGIDLTRAEHGLTIVDDGTPPPPGVASLRVGLTKGADLPWRWAWPGDPHLSRPA